MPMQHTPSTPEYAGGLAGTYDAYVIMLIHVRRIEVVDVEFV
jgi:hypothetical protein